VSAAAPETDDLLSLADDRDRLLLAGVKTALRDLARRWKALDIKIKAPNMQIQALVTAAARELAHSRALAWRSPARSW
jgi:transposase